MKGKNTTQKLESSHTRVIAQKPWLKKNAVQEFYLRTFVFQAPQACSMTALRRPRSFWKAHGDYADHKIYYAKNSKRRSSLIICQKKVSATSTQNAGQFVENVPNEKCAAFRLAKQVKTYYENSLFY